MPVLPGFNTNEGALFILTAAPSIYALSNNLINSFEPNDARKTNWVDSLVSAATIYYFPFKYKISSASAITEYSMVLRLAEQYLIRAEARTQQNNILGAQTDLNIIRARAGLIPDTDSTQSALLTAIYHERQVEFFTEWGQRWLDLKRTSRADSVMSTITPLKGGTWNTNWQLYPIPLFEIQNDPQLKQNPNY
jgi:hypothetical protein